MKKILLIILMVMIMPSYAQSQSWEIPAVVKKIQAIPLNHFDWGLYRTNERIEDLNVYLNKTKMDSNALENFNIDDINILKFEMSTSVLLDPKTNKIKIRARPDYVATSRSIDNVEDAQEICKLIISAIRDELNVKVDKESSLSISINFSAGIRDTRELLKMMEIQTEVIFKKRDKKEVLDDRVRGLYNTLLCKTNMLSEETYYTEKDSSFFDKFDAEIDKMIDDIKNKSKEKKTHNQSSQ